jgi:hypothetical protein
MAGTYRCQHDGQTHHTYAETSLSRLLARLGRVTIPEE